MAAAERVLGRVLRGLSAVVEHAARSTQRAARGDCLPVQESPKKKGCAENAGAGSGPVISELS
jgi:hypothetical protein